MCDIDEMNNLIDKVTQTPPILESNDYDKHIPIYPISDKMYYDINYHSNKYNYVNLYICPYQRQTDKRYRTFIQYFMYLDNNQLNFYNKSCCPQDWDNIKEYTNTLVKLIMANYRIFLTDNEEFEYNGFHIEDNNFYVFFDMTNVKINYHFLHINDPFWMVTIREIVDLKNVCEYPIDQSVTDLFNKHPELFYLTNKDKSKKYKLPYIGYSIEETKNMDNVLMFGMSSDENGNYIFNPTYTSCLHNEINNKVVIRYAIFDDKFTSLINKEGIFCISTKDYYAQTPINAYNIVDSEKNNQNTM